MSKEFGLIRHELKNPNKSAQQVIEDIQKSPLLMDNLTALITAKDPTFQKNSKSLTVLASLTNTDSLPENLKINPDDIAKLFGQIATVEKTYALSENEFVVTMESPIAAHLCKLAFDGLHIAPLGLRFDVEETPEASLFTYNSDRIVKTTELTTAVKLLDTQNQPPNFDESEEGFRSKANPFKEKHRLKNKGHEFGENQLGPEVQGAPLSKGPLSLTVGKPSFASTNNNVNKLLNNEPLSIGQDPLEAIMRMNGQQMPTFGPDKYRRFSTNMSDLDNHGYTGSGFDPSGRTKEDPIFDKFGQPNYPTNGTELFKMPSFNSKLEVSKPGNDKKLTPGLKPKTLGLEDLDCDGTKSSKIEAKDARKSSLKLKTSKLSLQKTHSTNNGPHAPIRPSTWARECEDSDDCVPQGIESDDNELEQWPLPNGIALSTTKSLLPQINSSYAGFNNPSNKFTCRYDVMIENEKNFQIAKKIIGSKGCNMKNIIENSLTSAGLKNHPNNKEAIKLRLRGRGSGFLEGADRRESDEMLHLCVSAKNLEVFSVTCRYVEGLLNKIYEEYISYQKKMGNEQVISEHRETLESFKFKKHEPVHGQYFF